MGKMVSWAGELFRRGLGDETIRTGKGSNFNERKREAGGREASYLASPRLRERSDSRDRANPGEGGLTAPVISQRSREEPLTSTLSPQEQERGEGVTQRRADSFSPAGENRYPPPRMVRITAGLVGSGSILRRIRMIRRSTARSKASLSRALANSRRRSRDSTRFGLAANTLSRPNSEAVSGCSLPSSSRSTCASRSSHFVPNRTNRSF